MKGDKKTKKPLFRIIINNKKQNKMNTIYQDYLEKRKSLIKETIIKEINFCNDIYKIIIEEQYYFEGDTKTFKLYSIHINGNYDKTYIRLPKGLKEFFNL